MPRKGEKTGVFIKCEYCGKKVYKTQSQLKNAIHHFCSNKCQKLQLHQDTYEDRKCVICGTIFNVPKISTQQLCSTSCQKEWQKTRVGKLNVRCTCDELPCEVCGKLILVKQYKIKAGEHHFCSDKCRQYWYATVFSQSLEWKKECKIRGAKLIKNSIGVNTKPQIIINNLLDNMKIKYTNEKHIKYWSLDNYLNDYNLIIEVMGDYWHSNPLCYRYKELNEVQKKRIPKDKAKNTFFVNKKTPILYLWESDIYNNIVLCQKLILKYIKQKGVLENYNSFNYYIVNGDIAINQNIIYPYFDKEYITNA